MQIAPGAPRRLLQLPGALHRDSHDGRPGRDGRRGIPHVHHPRRAPAQARGETFGEIPVLGPDEDAAPGGGVGLRGGVCGGRQAGVRRQAQGRHLPAPRVRPHASAARRNIRQPVRAELQALTSRGPPAGEDPAAVAGGPIREDLHRRTGRHLGAHHPGGGGHGGRGPGRRGGGRGVRSPRRRRSAVGRVRHQRRERWRASRSRARRFTRRARRGDGGHRSEAGHHAAAAGSSMHRVPRGRRDAGAGR